MLPKYMTLHENALLCGRQLDLEGLYQDQPKPYSPLGRYNKISQEM